MKRNTKLADPKTILEVYYMYPHELNTKEIVRIFPRISSATVARYKDAARDVMAERGIPRWSAYGVDTETAFEVWGINVKKLERSVRKQKELSLATDAL